MVLNKEKSQEFKKINSNTKFKKGLFVSILLMTLLLSGCVNKGNNLSSGTDISSVVVSEDENDSIMKVYQPGEHKVFYSIRNHYSSIANDVCSYPNVEVPDGYELVDTEFAMYHAAIDSQMVIFYEFVNNVPVVAEIIDDNSKIQKTSFGTPISLEDEMTKTK